MKSTDNSGPRRGTPSGDEDDSAMPLLVSRVSDRFIMGEQPPKHYARPYSYYDSRGGWGSPNSSYDPRGESSLQHRPVTDSWHHPDAPHSAYELHHIPPDDPYRRGVRDDYIRPEDTRSSWPEIRSPEDPRYPPPSGEWPERYTSSAHTTVNSWPAHGGRPPANLQRQGRSDWRQEGKSWHRDDGRTEGWRTNDSWEPRQGGHTGRQHNESKRKDSQNDRSQRNTEDRTWQPSASWQSSSRGGGNQGQRNQNNRRHQNRDRNGRGGRKGRFGHQQRRDFRPDDSHLNNWTKREGSGRAVKKDSGTGKERQQRTSLSRSRSPGDSYRSYPSDRSRSPSQSVSPQRRQRDSSVANNRGHTPSPGRDDRHKRRYSPSHSRSPEQPSSPLRPLSPNNSPTRKGKSPSQPEHPRHGRGHKRDLSPGSRSSSSRSRSRSRSLSLSPTERPRAVHRLPITTSVHDVNIPHPSRATQRTQNQNQNKPRDNGWPKRERGRNNGNARGPRRPAQDHVAESMPPPARPPQAPQQSHKDPAYAPDYPLSEHVSPIAHPPRDDILVPAAHIPRHDDISSSVPPLTDDMQPHRPSHRTSETSRPTPAGMGSFKIGGFKPIGQASSAVRKFFPGDEDEREDTEKRQSPPMLVPASHYRPPVPPPLVQNGQASFDSSGPFGGSFHRSHYDSAPHSPYSMSGRPLGNSPTHHDETAYDRPPVHDYAHYYENEQGRHRDQRGSAYYHDEQHFSRHNGHEYPPHDQDSARAPDHDFSHPHEPELTRPNTPSKYSRDELYAIVSQVGEGTFGKVYKARNTVSGLYVALKRIRMETERDGFPVTAMREIKLLQSLRHDNIVRLYEMMVSNGSVYMVFEYMDHDLTGVLSQSQFSFADAHLKSLCEQMLAGLAYLHHKGIIHRDIKGSNILVNNRGELKLADFGLARFYHKRRRSDYTNRVITLWYRPPELLFGTTVYGPEVDMWSAGCIMLELFTKRPVFQGNDEIHQLEFIFKILGTPTQERWPGVTKLPWYELVKPKEVIPNHFRDLFRKWLSPAGLDLAEELLAFDPLHRATAVQALEAPYFKAEAPSPAMPTGLSSLEGEWHELETKRERAKKRRKVEGGTAQ